MTKNSRSIAALIFALSWGRRQNVQLGSRNHNVSLRLRKILSHPKTIHCFRAYVENDTIITEAHVFLQLVDLHGSVRETTCVVIANMFGDALDPSDLNVQKQFDRMVRGGLCEKLIPRIVDPLKMVRLHALGALRSVLALPRLISSHVLSIETSVSLVVFLSVRLSSARM